LTGRDGSSGRATRELDEVEEEGSDLEVTRGRWAGSLVEGVGCDMAARIARRRRSCGDSPGTPRGFGSAGRGAGTGIVVKTFLLSL